MHDPRTQVILQMAVALISSGAPLYANRSVAEVTAELIGSADGIDHVFGICGCDEDRETEQ